MKLLVSVVDGRAAGRVSDALVAGGFGVTRLETEGGFLRRGNATLLVGVEDERVDAAVELMRAAWRGRSSNADASGGPVFVLGVDALARV